jgi:hypothetical protein
VSTLLRCNHLLYYALEFLGSFWVVVTEFFKLPLVFDSVDEVIYHLPIYDIIDLGSLLGKAAVVLLKGLIW